MSFSAALTLCALLVPTECAKDQDVVTLTHPLTAMGAATVAQWSRESSDNWRDFMNGDLSWGQYKKRGDYKWSNGLVVVVDSLTFDNFGKFQSYVMHLRNLLKKGSVAITDAANTTVEGPNTLSYRFCVKMVLDLTSSEIRKCLTRRQTFDDEMTLIRSEMTSDGTAEALFNYVLQLTTTTIMPASAALAAAMGHEENGNIDGDSINAQLRRLLSNPIFLSMAALVFGGTSLMAILICCIAKHSGRFISTGGPKKKVRPKNGQIYDNVEAFSSSFESSYDERECLKPN